MLCTLSSVLSTAKPSGGQDRQIISVANNERQLHGRETAEKWDLRVYSITAQGSLFLTAPP